MPFDATLEVMMGECPAATFLESAIGVVPITPLLKGSAAMGVLFAEV